MDQVPYLDIAGILNPEDGKGALFVLNGDLSRAHTIEINWEDKSPGQVVASWVLTGNDLKAVNSFDAPQRVTAQPLEKSSSSATGALLEVPARSYSVIQWSA